MSELTCAEINKIPFYVNASTTSFAFDHNPEWLPEALKHKLLSEESFRKFCRPFKVVFWLNIVVTVIENHDQFLQNIIEADLRWCLLEDDCLLCIGIKMRGQLSGPSGVNFLSDYTSDQLLIGVRTDEDKYAGFPCSLGKPFSIHPG